MGHVKREKIQAVAGRLYEAAMDPALWRPVLHEVADALGAHSAAVFGVPLAVRTGVFNSPGADEAFAWLAGPGAQIHNPRPERAIRASAARRVLTESDLFTDRELQALPFNAALTDLGFCREAGGIFSRVAGSPLFFTAQRGRRSERFGSAEIEAIEALFPHLDRAAQISARLWTSHADGMLDAYQTTACGAVLLDGMGHIVSMNAEAERLLHADLRVLDGRFAWKHEPSNQGLGQLLEALLAHEPGAGIGPAPVCAPLRRRQGGDLVVYGMPLQGAARNVLRRAKVILVVVDPNDARDVGAQVLADTYRLTPAEVRLARSMARGLDLRGAAEEHGVAWATARNQLKSIMAKTDTRRQAELVSLLTRLAVVPDRKR